MRDPDRIEPILNSIRRLWQETPDLRFCQIVETILLMGEAGLPPTIMFYVEDDVVERGLTIWGMRRLEKP